MSNEQNLPVYSVPGTGETPVTLYYLRSFSSLPDTEISQAQFDALSEILSAVATPAVAGAALTDAHAAVDPSSPAFQGAPAVNADVSGSAATQTSQPVQDPAATGADPVPDQPAKSQPATDTPAPDQGAPADTGTSESPAPAADPGTTAGDAPTDTSTPNPGTDTGTIPADGIPSSEPGTTDQPQPVEVASSGSDPNVSSPVPDSSSSTSETTTESPTSSTSESPASVDPTVVQSPPVDLPPEQHDAWFAQEKQRIVDLLKAEEDRVSNLTEPEV